MADSLQYLDEVIQKSVLNFYTLAKADGAVRLINFDFNNPQHLGLLYTVKLVKDVLHYKIYIKTNIFTFLKLRKIRDLLNYKLCFRKKDWPTCDEFINFTSVNEPEKFEKIHEEFGKELFEW